MMEICVGYSEGTKATTVNFRGTRKLAEKSSWKISYLKEADKREKSVPSWGKIMSRPVEV